MNSDCRSLDRTKSEQRLQKSLLQSAPCMPRCRDAMTASGTLSCDLVKGRPDQQQGSCGEMRDADVLHLRLCAGRRGQTVQKNAGLYSEIRELYCFKA